MRQIKRPWTPAEDDQLRREWATDASVRSIAAGLTRPCASVYRHAEVLKLPDRPEYFNRRAWPEDVLLRAIGLRKSGMSASRIAAAISTERRTYSLAAVKSMLPLVSDDRPVPVPIDHATLRATWEQYDTVRDIAAALGYAMSSINRTARKLRLPAKVRLPAEALPPKPRTAAIDDAADIDRLRAIWPMCTSRTEAKRTFRTSSRRLNRLAEAAGLTDAALMPRPIKVKPPRFTKRTEAIARAEALVRAEWPKHDTITAVARALMCSQSHVSRVSKRLDLPTKPRVARPVRERVRQPSPPRAQRPATAIPRNAPQPAAESVVIALPPREVIRDIDAGRPRHRNIPRTACQWPLGDPRAADFGFCGCRAAEGKPYCDDHMRLAYRQPGDEVEPGEYRPPAKGTHNPGFWSGRRSA